MDAKAMERWRAVRARGFLRFLAIYGGAFGIIFFVFMDLVFPPLLGEPRPDTAKYVRDAAIYLFVLGPAFGGVTWWLNERGYTRAQSASAARAAAASDGD